MNLSRKQKRLLISGSSNVDIVEGSVRSGKTFTLAAKFLTKVVEMKDIKGKNYVIAFDKQVFESVILPELRVWAPNIIYNPRGKGEETRAHLIYKGETILVGAFGTADKFKKILGSTIKTCLATEINLIPKEEFFTKLMDRMANVEDFYFGGDLNPANPDHWIYQYANKCEPQTETPNLNEIIKTPSNKRWEGWHFVMEDNPTMTTDLIGRQLARYPHADHPLYKANILGIRCVAEGLVFDPDQVKACIDHDYEKWRIKGSRKMIGVDTSYSTKSKDLTTIVPVSITNDGHLYIFPSFGHNNRDKVMIPSDVANKIKEYWNNHKGSVAIDSSDKGTIETTLRMYPITRAYGPDKNKFGIIDRIRLLIALFALGKIHIHPDNEGLIDEFLTTLFSDKESEQGKWADGGTHYIDALCYAILDYRHLLQRNL